MLEMKYNWVDCLKDDLKALKKAIVYCFKGDWIKDFFKGIGSLFLLALCLSLLLGILFLVIKLIKWMWIHA